MKTISYEISKKLAEIGFKSEEASFFWVKWHEGDPVLVYQSECTPSLIEKVAAYDLETVLHALPDMLFGCVGKLIVFKNGLCFDCSKISIERQKNETLADTAARLLMLLVEKGLLTFNK